MILLTQSGQRLVRVVPACVLTVVAMAAIGLRVIANERPDNGPSKTTIADYLELDGFGTQFLERFDNKIDNRGLSGSNFDLGPILTWDRAYGLAAPLRPMKGYQSQGGVRNQRIVKPPRNWKISHKVVTVAVHVIDIMPTPVETTGGMRNTEQSGKRNTLPIQGLSLQNSMRGGNDALFEKCVFGSKLFGIRAYRLGKWKRLNLPIPHGTVEWQLDNLWADPGELTNLAVHFPDRLKLLADRWSRYATENGVIEPAKPVAFAKPPR